eukprot:9249834-Heterocapsa_arctica.AAC.1
MAAVAADLTEEGEKNAFESAGSDLEFFCSKGGVPGQVRAKIYRIGIHSVRQFGMVVQDTAELFRVLKDDFGVDSASNISTRDTVAKILVAWADARLPGSK